MDVPFVICVDDEPSFAALTAKQLERKSNVEAQGFTDPNEALAAVSESVDCIVSDFDMPGMDGLELLETIREEHPELPFVLFTGKGSESVASEAISKGVTEYLQKSTRGGQYDVLANRVENAIEGYRTKRQLESQRSLVDRIVETMPYGVVVHDATGDVVVANEHARSIIGMPNDFLHLREYDGTDWALYDDDGSLLEQGELPVARILDGEASIDDETYVLESGDERNEIVLRAAPLLNDEDVTYVIVAFALVEAFDDIGA